MIETHHAHRPKLQGAESQRDAPRGAAPIPRFKGP
jgi:hypothetical protein